MTFVGIIMPEVRLIKKYPNRRLYDTEESCYITLSEVRNLVVNNVPIKVIDRNSNEDITRTILLQIIMEQEAGGEPLFNIDMLARFIRNYGIESQQNFSSFLQQSMEFFAEQQANFQKQVNSSLGNPMDMWMKWGEKNMQSLQRMQNDIFANPFTPSNPGNPNSDDKKEKEKE